MDRTSALIVAAGLGTRAGTQIPKQFAPLGGKPMVAHSVEALKANARISAVRLMKRIHTSLNTTSHLPANRSPGPPLDGTASPPFF